MYILYDNTPWEKQYLFQDLLPNDHILISFNKRYPILNFFKKMKDINKIISNNILIFSSNTNSYNNINMIVSFLKPNVIIHLSDEWGDKNIFQELSKHTKILFRQYYHPHYSHYDNIKYIPLGYMTDMLEQNYLELPLKLPDKRKYIWSFIGNKVKKDRPNMLNAMNKISPNFTDNVEKNSEIANIYRESIFVPTCMGNVGLNTLRITEAIACGAIPIITGLKQEIIDTFKYEINPPWLSFENWDDAYLKCVELLKDKDMLNKLSINVQKWWKENILYFREKILNPFII